MLVPADQVGPRFDKALDNRNYDLAAALLGRLPESHPGADALRRRFTTESASYEQEVIRKATGQANRGRWIEAFDTLDEGRERWRDSPAIAHAYQALEAREARLYRRLHAELVLAEADWILSRHKQADELEQFHRRDARRLAVSWDRRASSLAERLRKLADRFIAAEDWAGAQKLLLAAGEISGEDVSSQLATVEKQIHADTATGGGLPHDVKARAGSLLAAYETSGNMSDLVAARRHIFSHNSAGQLDTYAARLEDLSRRRFEQGVIAGDQLYAAGRYQEAKDTWEAILQLYPDDAELQKKLERAEKVLKNLRALSREQRP